MSNVNVQHSNISVRVTHMKLISCPTLSISISVYIQKIKRWNIVKPKQGRFRGDLYPKYS